ncbi:hypothetical protein TNCV_387601 [Trichonephila clavipes]|nr:hypothetical protein TNCV_387601 [Trichonephila clavipes]
MIHTLGEEASVLVEEQIFNSSLDHIVVKKSPSLQNLLEGDERFNILKDNWGRWKQLSRTLIGSFMARRKPRVLTLGQS